MKERSAAEPIAAVELHRQERERFFARFGALWPGTLPDPYELLGLYALDHSEIAAITGAAAAITRVYVRVSELLKKCPTETYRQMGLPPEFHTAVRARIPGLAATVLGRMDLVRAPQGYKLLEFNADVAGMLVESFWVNRHVCEDAGERDVNEGRESALARGLETAIRCSLNHLGILPGQRQAGVAFAASRMSLRDTEIARCLAGLIRCTQSCAVDELQADEDGVYDAEGSPIDVLFRIYPLELFPYTPLRAIGNTRRLTWMWLLELLERRRVVLLNPPSACLLNSKAVQAIIWHLHRTDQFFDADEQALIEAHFLPTYMDPVFGDQPYVIKPVYGHQGDTVTVVNASEGMTVKSDGTTYSDQPMVYQKYVELPQIRRMTEGGPRDLHLVASCFVVNGEPGGICVRAGGIITDESAWYLPLCVRR